MTERGTDTAHAPGSADGDAGAAVPLPEFTRGRTRAQQRRARRRQKRQRKMLVIAVLAVVLGVAAFFVGRSATEDGKGNDDQRAAAATAAPPVLLAQKDATGRGVTLVVLAPAPASGGTVILIPPGTMADVPSLGPEPVAVSLQQGDATLTTTVENLLGVELAATVVLDDGALANLLNPVGLLTVEVPQRVEEVDPSGRVQVVFEAGDVAVAPADAGRFLSVKGRASDLVRLARHQRFMEAWIDAVRARPDAAPVEPPGLAKAFDALVAGTVHTQVLPVEAFGTAGASGELYRVREGELAALVTSVFPGAAAAGPRPRVQILNGTGAVGLSDAVRSKLGAGFDVRLTGNAGTFDHDSTEVVYYDRSKETMARRVRDALGLGTLVFSRNPLDVVDVTIIVGKDFKTA